MPAGGTAVYLVCWYHGAAYATVGCGGNFTQRVRVVKKNERNKKHHIQDPRSKIKDPRSNSKQGFDRRKSVSGTWNRDFDNNPDDLMCSSSQVHPPSCGLLPPFGLGSCKRAVVLLRRQQSARRQRARLAECLVVR